MTQSVTNNEIILEGVSNYFTFLAGIELGNIRKDCDGFGICKIEIIDHLRLQKNALKEKQYDITQADVLSKVLTKTYFSY